MIVEGSQVIWCDGCSVRDHKDLLYLDGKSVHIFDNNLEYLEWCYEKRLAL
jgi:hypothetical protein